MARAINAISAMVIRPVRGLIGAAPPVLGVGMAVVSEQKTRV